MLDNAKKYEAELVGLFHNIAYDSFYNFEQMCNFRETFKVPDNTWEGAYFTSMLDGEIIGYIAYSIERSANYAHGLNILHFKNEKIKASSREKEYWVFGRDVMTALKDVFERFGFNKLCFACVIGNPIEKTYDRLIKRYGGRIVGTFRKDRRLITGRLYDVKHYEILAEEYFASKKRNKISEK